jgi:hypothetical protein
MVLVPDTDEMMDAIRRYVGPPPEGVKWIILAPGSTVTDIREAAEREDKERQDAARMARLRDIARTPPIIDARARETRQHDL